MKKETWFETRYTVRVRTNIQPTKEQSDKIMEKIAMLLDQQEFYAMEFCNALEIEHHFVNKGRSHGEIPQE